jgi:5'-3' exonuclease
LTIALIDGDIGIYRVGFASQAKNANGEPEAIPLPLCLARMDTWVADILKATNAKAYRIYLTADDKSNFRFDIYPEYKANRKSPRPIYYGELREHLIRFYPTTVVSGMEADDALGQAQTDSTVICSIDKDLDQIPGRHYDFVKDVVYEVSKDTADRFFWYQLLMGDATDNIPGIPGCGPKTAQRILDGADSGDFPQVVYDAYEAYYGESRALKMMTLMGQLLKIKQQEGEGLWQPPNNIQIESNLTTDQDLSESLPEQSNEVSSILTTSH